MDWSWVIMPHHAIAVGAQPLSFRGSSRKRLYTGKGHTGRGDANTPPFFTNGFEPFARVTLYVTDETTLHDMLGAA